MHHLNLSERYVKDRVDTLSINQSTVILYESKALFGMEMNQRNWREMAESIHEKLAATAYLDHT